MYIPHLYINYDFLFAIQDCLATISPFPYSIGNCGKGLVVEDSLTDPVSILLVHHHLFFHCTICPQHSQPDSYGRCQDYIPLDFVFLSAFEDQLLQMTGIMKSNAVRNAVGIPEFSAVLPDFPAKLTIFSRKQECAHFGPFISRRGVYNSAVERAMTRPVHVRFFGGRRFSTLCST